MALPPTQPSRGDRRRREILDAALACFLENGVEATTLEQIRERSGASTGSIYHLFSSKDAIAGALFLESLRDLHALLIASAEGAADGHEALTSIVSRYVDWVVREPDRTRFLLRAPRGPVEASCGPALLAENRAFLGRMKELVIAHQKSGELRAMPMDVLVALVLAPMQEYARQHLAGTAKTPPARAARELGEAVWRALRA